MSELSYNGIVEMYRENGWIRVCGNADWDVADAQVVCARLGYYQARVLTWSTSSVYSRWMYAVRCVGNESSLQDCPHQLRNTYCRPAGVECLNCEYSYSAELCISTEPVCC